MQLLEEANEPEPPAVAPTGPLQIPEDAEQRFFARYGVQIGSTDWAALRYFNTPLPKIRTVDRWLSGAERVRDHAAPPSS